MMQSLALNEIVELKEEIYKNFKINIHLHDTCGGQYFTLDENNTAITEYLRGYFSKKNLTILFSQDELQFSVK
jgi:hypothetical protein